MHSHDRTLLSRLGFADPDKKDRRHDLACQYLAQDEIAMRLVDIVTHCVVGRQQWAVIKTIQECHIAKGQGQYKTTIGFADLCIRFSVLADESGDLLSTIRIRAVDQSLQEWSEKRRNELRMRHHSERFDPFDHEQTYKDACIRHGEEEDRLKEAVASHVIAEKARLLQIPADWKFVGDRGCYWIDPGTDASYHDQPASLLVEVKVQAMPTCDVLRQLALYRTYMEPTAILLATAFDLSVEDVTMLKREKVHHIRLGSAFDVYCQRRKEQTQMAASLEI